MRIEAVELRRVHMPLATPFRTAHSDQTDRDVLLVRVTGPDGEGWGECAATNEPLYTSEYTAGAHAVIRDHLLPRLSARADLSAEALGPALAAVKGHEMAKAALEMAVLDAQLTHAGRSLASHLGAVRSRVEAGVAVGIPGSIAELLDVVGRHVDEGYRRVKLKIRPGWDVEPVSAVRERFGPSLLLQVDGNGSYRLEDAEHLRDLDPFGLLMIEQPLGDDDLEGHASLARRIRTPICLDESIVSAAAADRAIRMGACAVVNVKAPRVGGYLEARRVHDVCVGREVPAWCGGMLETGLGRAANLALAALPGFTLPGDLSASDRYWTRDLTIPFVIEDGWIAVPTGPGLGVRPDPQVLAEVTTSTEVVRLDR